MSDSSATRTCLLVLCFVLAWMPTLAQAASRIVVCVHAPEDAVVDAMHARVAPELESRGFFVVEARRAEPLAEEPFDDLLALARTTDAALAVAIELSSTGDTRIEVVAVSGKRARRMLQAHAQGRHGPSTIALATAELVDALRLELDAPVAPARDAHAAPQASSSAPRLQTDGSLGVLWPVRIRVPVAVASVALGLRPSRRIALSAEGTVPLHALRSEVELATLRTFPFLVGLRTDVDVMPQGRAIAIDIEAGVSALAVRIEVDPAPGVDGHPQTVWTTAVTSGIALHRRIGRRILVGARLRLLLPFEDLRIRVVGETVQRLGSLWFGAAISVGARW